VVYLTDSKQHERPDTATVKAQADKDQASETRERVPFRRAVDEVLAEDHEAMAKLAVFDSSTREQEARKTAPFEALKAALKTGIRVVSVPQLFPTPPELAKRMVELAGIGPKDRVLEPSAGTGNLLHAIVEAEATARIRAVEFNPTLCATLPSHLLEGGEVLCADFLSCTVEQLGRFDKIVMNPPFTNGADVDHVKHALSFLEPGGVLVALCANGPRQQAALRPLATTWEDLPDGTFASEGTNVRVALMTARKGS
jgi:protein-L-isoaspartate O-methyltransferase